MEKEMKTERERETEMEGERDSIGNKKRWTQLLQEKVTRKVYLVYYYIKVNNL